MKKSKFGMLALIVAVAAVGLAIVSSGFVSAAVPPALEVGKPVPDFKLKDYEGKEHSLSAAKGKIAVISFTSQHCPYSKGTEASFAKLAETYGAKDVVFYSIDSHAQTTAAEIAKYATEENDTGKKLPYPILKDEGNKYADALGATRTPEIYIVDKEGKLVYHGAIDNQKKTTDSGYKSFTQAALDEMLAGKPVSEPMHTAYGCGIKRKSA
ncbi:MAG: redoxin domain-containing protein [Candidatus Hydrogenedentes bacterium]|nr:redoxin domain-containing protein [Candidatus Hydrogenedentota bacterium]